MRFVAIKTHKLFEEESLISHTDVSWVDCASFEAVLALLLTLLKLVIIKVLRCLNYSPQKHGGRAAFCT